MEYDIASSIISWTQITAYTPYNAEHSDHITQKAGAALLKIDIDKVSRRLAAQRCPYRRKDWAEFPLDILTDKILLFTLSHGKGRGYIFIFSGFD